MKEVLEDEADHFLSDDFDIDSHDFDFNTLRNKANLALAPYRRKSFCY